MRIGALALQGAFAEHLAVLRGLGVEGREVRLAADLQGLDGLIIPGGESTAMGLLAREFGLLDPLRDFGATRAIWGTCAGAILLSRSGDREAESREVRLGLMDMVVDRNAMGRQVESFTIPLVVPALADAVQGAPEREPDPSPFPGVFIRAPVIREVNPGRVQVLARLPSGTIAAVRQDRLLATAFHPELTSDRRFHQYFLGLAGS